MAAVIKIEVQTSGGVDQVKKDLQDVGNTAKEAGGGFDAMREVATGALRAIGEGVVGLAVKGLGALKDAISDGIEDAKQNAQIQAQTAAVLKSTGNAAQTSAEHIADYASSLSDAAGKSLFGDDQIQQSTNLLLTFTNIKGASLDAATAISVDMAQALGGAPKDAAIQLGKALNDPIKGITALTRVGVTFTDEQKAQIQAMQEAGDMAGAQQVILDELNKEFGGSAQAAAAATGGWSEFNGRLGEAKEALGAAVLPLLNQLAGFLNDSVLPVVEAAAQGFADWLGSPEVQAGIASIANGIQSVADAAVGLYNIFFNGDFTGGIFGLQEDDPIIDTLFTIREAFASIGGVINDLVSGGIGVFLDDIREMTGIDLSPLLATFTDARNPIEGFLNVLGEISPTFALVRGTIEAILPPILSIVQAIFGQISTFIATNGDDIKAFIQQTWQQIGTIIDLALQLIKATVVPALQAVAGFINAHGTEIQSLLQNTWNALKAIIDAALTLIQGVIKAALQIIQGDWSGAWETIQQMCARIVLDIGQVIQAGLNNIVTMFGGMVDSVMTTLNGWVGQMATVGSNLVAGIQEGFSSAWGSFTSWLIGQLDGLKDEVLAFFGIESPSKVFADEVGAPLVAGLMEGVQGMIPSLMSVLDDVALAIIGRAKKVTEEVVDEANKIQDELIKQAEGLGDKISNAMSDAFAGEASLDRAKAKAVGMLKDIGEAQQQEVQRLLGEASTTASGFGDPKQAAAFFKLRSDQIFELAKLQAQIDKTEDANTKARLIEQYNLIGAAQRKELDAFGSKVTNSPVQAIVDQIQKVLTNPNVPAGFDDPTGTLTQLFNALPQLTALLGGGPQVSSSMYSSSQFTYAPTINTTGSVSPPMDYGTAKSLASI